MKTNGRNFLIIFNFLILFINFRKYLLGFRKRKIERKKKAKEELDQLIRKEKKRQKELVIFLMKIFCYYFLSFLSESSIYT